MNKVYEEWLYAVPLGWQDLFIEVMEEIDSFLEAEHEENSVEILDVKEKWNELSMILMYKGENRKIEDYLLEKEKELRELSRKICFICGQNKDIKEKVCHKCETQYSERALKENN